MRAGRAAAVGVLEPDPAAQHQTREPFARRVRDDGGDVDAEQPHVTNSLEIDDVAADHGAHEHGVGLFDGRNGRCRNSNHGSDDCEQNLHRDLLRQ